MKSNSSIHRAIVAGLATILLALSTQWGQLPYARSFFTQTPISTTPETTVPVPTGYERVVHVADGDTVTLENGEKVRYIGIDAPELHETPAKSTCFGQEAKKLNEDLVLGRDVRLEADRTNRDRYGRLLRYVYVKDGNGGEQLVNEILVQEGAAKSYAYKPDVAKQATFDQAQTVAQANHVGLWASCQ